MYDIKTVPIRQGQGKSILIFSNGIQKLCIDCLPGGSILIKTPSGKTIEKIIPVNYDHVRMEINKNIKKINVEV